MNGYTPENENSPTRPVVLLYPGKEAGDGNPSGRGKFLKDRVKANQFLFALQGIPE